jgi:predicted nucleic acid-binding protein
MVLLDTTVLIDALRNRDGQRAALARMVTDGIALATSAINVAEVCAGMRVDEANRTEMFLSALTVLPITGEIGQRAGTLKAEQGRAGRTVSLADMLVAATAMAAGAGLLTDNRKDFSGIGVRLLR